MRRDCGALLASGSVCGHPLDADGACPNVAAHQPVAVPELAMFADLQVVLRRLAEQGGVLGLGCDGPGGEWVASITFGCEAEDSPMVGGAAYGVAATAGEALRRAVDDTGWRPARTPATAVVLRDAAGLPQAVAEPGSPAPVSGFVVGECRHLVAQSEWRAGFRICEHCSAGTGRADAGPVPDGDTG